jgi:hypothetical protein
MTDDDFKKLTIEEYDNYYWPILRTIWDKNACLSGADQLGNDAGEAKAQIYTAMNMNAEKLPVEMIIRATGLTLEKLQHHLKNYDFFF